MIRLISIVLVFPVFTSVLVWLLTRKKVNIFDLSACTTIVTNLVLNGAMFLRNGIVVAVVNHYSKVFIGVSILTSLLVSTFVYFLLQKVNEKGKVVRVARLTTIVLLGSSVLMFNYVNWLTKSNGLFNFEILLFNLSVKLDTNTSHFLLDMVRIFFMPIVVIACLIYLFYFSKLFIGINKEYRKREGYLLKLVRMTLPLVILISASAYSFKALDIRAMIDYYKDEDTFIQRHYVEANDSILTFPEKKRNLIVIFAESFEATYFDKENGGWKEENLLPNMTKRIKSGNAISFSHNEHTLGGMKSVPGAMWSIAGMTAQLSGVPHKTTIDVSEHEGDLTYLPGIISVGEMLETEGYQNAFNVGSHSHLFGIGAYYRHHGNHQINDYGYFLRKGLIPEDYLVFMGIEDKKLYEYSKDVLLDLASNEDPFNLVIETQDTHFPNGYTDPSCPANYSSPYANAISCADSMLEDLLSWIENQEFYDNTTIVVVGDHLSMDTEYFQGIDDYERTVFNMIINPVDEVKNSGNLFSRDFYAMDMYPTILSSIGVKIEGDRLGLGTDLFSGRQTLYEKLGVEPVRDSLFRNSKFYNDYFVYGNRNWRVNKD